MIPGLQTAQGALKTWGSEARGAGLQERISTASLSLLRPWWQPFEALEGFLTADFEEVHTATAREMGVCEGLKD